MSARVLVFVLILMFVYTLLLSYVYDTLYVKKQGKLKKYMFTVFPINVILLPIIIYHLLRKTDK